jgi:uncharacterized protein with LGFP repeats
MKRIALALALATLAGWAAAAEKTYQVTGPVVEVKPDSIVVQKGKENWEIAKGGVATEVKKGDKVTVQYKMTATSIEVKKK